MRRGATRPAGTLDSPTCAGARSSFACPGQPSRGADRPRVGADEPRAALACRRHGRVVLWSARAKQRALARGPPLRSLPDPSRLVLVRIGTEVRRPYGRGSGHLPDGRPSRLRTRRPTSGAARASSPPHESGSSVKNVWIPLDFSKGARFLRQALTPRCRWLGCRLRKPVSDHSRRGFSTKVAAVCLVVVWGPCPNAAAAVTRPSALCRGPAKTTSPLHLMRRHQRVCDDRFGGTDHGQDHRHRPRHDEQRRRDHGGARAQGHRQRRGRAHDAQRRRLGRQGRGARRADRQAPGGHQPREHHLQRQALHRPALRRGGRGDQARPLQGRARARTATAPSSSAARR